MVKYIYPFFGLFLSLMLHSCGPNTPLKSLQNELATVNEYAIILEDMNEEGNFFRDYYHRYKVVTEKPTDGDPVFDSYITDWQKVAKEEYQKHENHLGMVIASRSKENGLSDDQYPPGYQYVGNSQYGEWRTDNNGNSFWEFYGKYAMFRTLFGMVGGPVYRSDWNDYRGYRNSGRPFYGSRNQYGTGGVETKKTNPTFFQRRQQRESSSRKSFSNRVQERTKRSNMSNTRQRSSKGFGK